MGPWLSLQVRGQDQGCGPPPFPTRTQRPTPTARLTCISCQQRKEETTKGVGTVKVTLFLTHSLTPPPNPPTPLNRSSDSSQQEVTAVLQMTVTTQDVGRLDQSGPDRKQALCFMKRPPSVTTGLAAQTRSTLPRAAAATFPRPRSPSC